jgi:hypothetical protein
MPTYDFMNEETGEMESHQLRISELDKFKIENPHLSQRLLKAPKMISGTGLQGKMDDGWKENLTRIAEAHPTSALADRVGGRTTKTVKTQEAIKKHTGERVLKKGTNYGLDNPDA